MNIIVTGGAGFIGSNFVFHMLKKYPDYRIICLDKLTYAGNLSTLAPVMDNPNFRFVKADICDREAVDKLFEEEHPDIVVNFAAESHVDRSIEDPGIFLQTNIIGTSVLMDACRKYGIQRYHQVSTDEVYGDLPLDRPDLFFTEETPIHAPSLPAVYEKYKERGGHPVFHPADIEPFTTLLTDIYDLASSSDYIRDMRINEKLGMLLTLLMEQSWHPESVTVSRKRLELAAVKEYLDEHYTEKLTLDDLADRQAGTAGQGRQLCVRL